jgi:hypothetical protein
MSPLSLWVVQVRNGKSKAGDVASWVAGDDVLVVRSFVARVGDGPNPNAPADGEFVCEALESLPKLLPMLLEAVVPLPKELPDNVPPNRSMPLAANLIAAIDPDVVPVIGVLVLDVDPVVVDDEPPFMQPPEDVAVPDVPVPEVVVPVDVVPEVELPAADERPIEFWNRLFAIPAPIRGVTA